MPATTKLHVVGMLETKTGVAGATTTQFNGIPDLRMSTGMSEWAEQSGANVDPDFLALGEQNPGLSGTMLEIKKFLDLITLDGLPIGDVGTTGNQVQAQWVRMKPFSVRELPAATKHFFAKSRKAGIYPQQITAARNRRAQITFQMQPVWDGTNDIVEFSSDVAGLTPGIVSELYALGPVNISGVELPSLQGWTYNVGVELEVNFHGGQVWPDFVAIARRQPVFECQCKDVPQITLVTLSGMAQGATDSEIYLRKVERNKKRIADATANHIKFQVNDGRITVQDLGGPNARSSDVNVRIYPAFDGTTAAVLVNTASTIVVP